MKKEMVYVGLLLTFIGSITAISGSVQDFNLARFGLGILNALGFTFFLNEMYGK